MQHIDLDINSMYAWQVAQPLDQQLLDEIQRLANKILKEMQIKLNQPEPKYKFSRNWYQAEFDPADYFAVDKWCVEQFGPHPKHPDAWSRWWHKFENSILIRDQEDYFNFVLRWGKH